MLGSIRPRPLALSFSSTGRAVPVIRLLLLVELVVVSSRDLLVVGEGGSNSFRGAVGSNTGKAGGWVVIDREDVED